MPIDSRERSRPLASIAVIARYDPSRALPDAGRILIRWPVALQEAGLSERHLQRLRSSAPIDVVNVTSGLPRHASAFALFHAWIEYAAIKSPLLSRSLFFGRMDDDVVLSLPWLDRFLSGILRRFESTHLYIGRFEYFSVDLNTFRPHGWGASPTDSLGWIKRVCKTAESRHRKCSGPFPFAQGPLATFSSSVAKWYVESDLIQANVQHALSTHSSQHQNLSRRASRSLGHKLFDDVFVGHQLCMGPRAGRYSPKELTRLMRNVTYDRENETERGALKRVTLISIREWPWGAIEVDYGYKNRWNEMGRLRRGRGSCADLQKEKEHSANRSVWFSAERCFCAHAEEEDDAYSIPPIVHNVKSAADRMRVARRVRRSRFEWRLAANCTRTRGWRYLGCGREWRMCELRRPCAQAV